MVKITYGGEVVKKKKELHEIIYVEKDKIYNILLILIMMTFLIFFIGFISLDFTKNIIKLLSIIISFSIMMITFTSSNINDNRHFYFISMTYVIVSAIGIFKIISEGFIHSFFNYRVGFSYIFPQLLVSIVMLLCKYFIYNSTKTYIKIKYWLIVLCTFIFSFIVGNLFNNLLICNIFGTLFSTLILLIAVIKCRNLPLTKGQTFNYVKLYIFYLIFSNILEIVQLVLKKSLGINIMHEYVNLFFYVIFCGCLLQKMLNNSYKDLFNDIYKRNSDLNELNREIMAKSMELEFSQKILYKREIMFKNLFKNIPSPMLLLNLTNGRIIYANPAFQSIIKENSLKKVINRKVTEFVKFKFDNSFEDENSKFEFTKLYYAQVNHKYKRIELEFQFVEISQDDEQCLVIITDITDKINMDVIKTKVAHKKIEEKLRSDFLSNISHDLKIPINVIYSAAQLEKLLISRGNFDELRRYNRISRDNCISLIRLTNNLIDNSRLSSDFLKPNLEYCNLVEIVEDIIMKLAEYIKAKDVDLIFDTEFEEIYMYLDRDFMERIILNLMANALKYTPKKGRILVNIEDKEKFTTIQVIDNGVGMEEEFVNVALNRYSRGKNNSYITEKGTGIGLFVVKNLTELQNGSIEIKSKLGEGTSVILKFNKESKDNGSI